MTPSDPDAGLLAGRSDRFAAAIAAIDAANAADPVTVPTVAGERPRSVLEAQHVTAWLRRLVPDASDEQLLAGRAHHLRRWEMPRASYPEGRAGYLRWRAAQKRRHADDVAAILAAAGYGPEEVARVQRIIRKEGLGRDPEVQAHEDALCLVFLRDQFVAFAAAQGSARTIEIVRKTAAKMSEQALAAVAELGLPDEAMGLIERALAG